MVELLDCTLRDGSNIVGAGFSKNTTIKIIEALIDSGITVIEMGHSSGIGGNSTGTKLAPLSDQEYIEVAKPYFSKAEIGMFCQPKWSSCEVVKLAAVEELGFLRVGINAGDSSTAVDLIGDIRSSGMKARTSLMKAYVLPPEELAEEALMLERAGANAVTIMDSAGYMLPEDVIEYVKVLKGALKIPVGFHGHNNLGLAVANGLAAWRAGADSIDCGIMGMARSVGNIPTEVFVAVLHRLGVGAAYDLHTLLSHIDGVIMPMLEEHYHNPIPPLQLILGMAGCHSHYMPMFKSAAEQYKVNLYKLILEVSEMDKKAPSQAMIDSHAKGMA